MSIKKKHEKLLDYLTIREQIGHEDEETTYRCYCFNRKTKAETNILFEKALSTVNTAS